MTVVFSVCVFTSSQCWEDFCNLFYCCFCSEEVARHGFTVIVDMRGSKWDSIKPLLKILQESFPSCIHVALIIKPDNFWQKQRTNFGSSKFEFEVRFDLKTNFYHISISSRLFVWNNSWFSTLKCSDAYFYLCYV